MIREENIQYGKCQRDCTFYVGFGSHWYGDDFVHESSGVHNVEGPIEVNIYHFKFI